VVIISPHYVAIRIVRDVEQLPLRPPYTFPAVVSDRESMCGIVSTTAFLLLRNPTRPFASNIRDSNVSFSLGVVSVL